MSFWAPYKMIEEPMDLRKRSVVKPEMVSPTPSTSSQGSDSQYHHQYYSCPTPSPPQMVPAQRHSPSEDSQLSFHPLSSQAAAGQSTFPALSSPPAFPMRVLPQAVASSKILRTSQAASEAAKQDLQYEAFRAVMLEARLAQNGGALTVTNPRMRRAVRRSSEMSDDADYMERRARNNAAAKRSRDLRKHREAELAIRVAYLESQNRQLQSIIDDGELLTKCNCYKRLN